MGIDSTLDDGLGDMNIAPWMLYKEKEMKRRKKIRQFPARKRIRALLTNKQNANCSLSFPPWQKHPSHRPEPLGRRDVR
jgi:hypothetical protein